MRRARCQATDEKERVEFSLNLLKASLCGERKQSSFALHAQFFCIGGDLNFINNPANQAIRSTENLEGADEIKFVDGRHDDGDDALALEARASARVGRGSSPGHLEVNMQ